MRVRITSFLILCLIWSPWVNAQSNAIASAHPLATEAGFEIFDAGGNAFDVAVAVSAVLAVVEPSSSGMGGGGFWLLHRASDQFETMVDGREKAPYSAHRDMYLDDQGAIIPDLSLTGPLAAGIPGLPAALVHIAQNYGDLALAKSLEPAMRVARDGFVVDDHYLQMAKIRLDVLQKYPASSAQFLDQGQAPESGFRLIQKELAKTLNALAGQGFAGFYQGEVAKLLVDGVNAAGGSWEMRDLADYRTVERAPVRGSYRGMRITTAPPPSSGGVALIEIFNMLERFDLSAVSAQTRQHLIIEAMRRAYRDRAEYLGDPDFVSVPMHLLTSKNYAAGLQASIRADKATASASLPEALWLKEGADTTHFSVLDKAGNRVAATLSINIPFGSGFVPPGTGVILNDEMDDFAAKKGAPNVYGLVGTHANAIEPGKRPLSSMTPTFIRDGDRLAILGTPGGSRIITMVLLGALEFAEGSDDPVDWVSAPRFHHQYLPDAVQFEPGGLTEEQQQGLIKLGHELSPIERKYGNMQAIFHNRATGQTRAASDPRRKGLAAVR